MDWFIRVISKFPHNFSCNFFVSLNFNRSFNFFNLKVLQEFSLWLFWRNFFLRLRDYNQFGDTRFHSTWIICKRHLRWSLRLRPLRFLTRNHIQIRHIMLRQRYLRMMSLFLFKLIRCLSQSLKSITLSLKFRELISEFISYFFPSKPFSVKLILKNFNHSLFLFECLPDQAV